VSALAAVEGLVHAESEGWSVAPVAVIICAYTEDRWDDIIAAVSSCEEQSTTPSEIVVVVDHNPALALRLRSALGSVSVVENAEQRGLSGARNTGINATTAEIVAFLDDDARASPTWIEGLVARYRDERVVAVGGHAEPLWPAGSPSWFPAEFGWVVGCSYTGQPRETAPVRNPIGCNMSFRRQALEEVGGFSHGIGRVGTRAVGCEETELSLRVKVAFPDAVILYDPEVMVEHRVTTERTSTRYFAQRCFAEGLSKSIVATLAGTDSGLSSERTYLRSVLPKAVLRYLATALTTADSSAACQALAVLGGVTATVAGYAYGSVSSERRRVIGTLREAPGPRKVVEVDLDLPLPSISQARLGDRPYASAHVFARRGRQPLGEVEIELGAEPFGGPELRSLLCAQLRELPPVDPQPTIAPLPRATVVVATNVARPRELTRCVESLLALDYPDVEVLIVDNRRLTARAADPLRHLEALDGVEVLTEDRPGASAARNAGMRAASGEIVAFTDDDAIVDPQWLRELATAMVVHEADCVTGLVVPAELETPAQIWFEEYGGFGKGYRTVIHEITRVPRRSPLFPYAAGMFGSGNNVAFTKAALAAVGGFNERLGPGTPTKSGEDLALFIAVLSEGGRLVYEPSAIVHHSHRRTYDELRTQVHDYGMGLTAMLTSLVASDPRHLVAITRRLPHGLRLLLSPSSEKNAQHRSGYPRELALMEVRGMLKGPRAYLTARRVARRSIWRR